MDDVSLSRLLLSILGRDWPRATRWAPAAIAAPGRFADLCERCEVGPRVLALLERHDRTDLLGGEARERLQSYRSRIQRDNLLLIARAESILGTLRASGVVPVVLKGLDLIHRIYKRFDERVIGDIDLLVARRDLRPALAALETHGWSVPSEPERTRYIRSSHHIRLMTPEEAFVPLELHWNLAQASRFRVDVEGLIERSRSLRIGDGDVLRLEDHDLVAHLLLHQFTHYFDRRLKWAVDIDLISRRDGFDWDRVTDRIRSWGARTAAAAAIVHLRKCLPDSIPLELQRRLPLGRGRRLLLGPLRSAHPLDLYRGTRGRWVQRYLALVLFERPSRLPAWVVRMALRNRAPGDNPLDTSLP